MFGIFKKKEPDKEESVVMSPVEGYTMDDLIEYVDLLESTVDYLKGKYDLNKNNSMNPIVAPESNIKTTITILTELAGIEMLDNREYIPMTYFTGETYTIDPSVHIPLLCSVIRNFYRKNMNNLDSPIIAENVEVCHEIIISLINLYKDKDEETTR